MLAISDFGVLQRQEERTTALEAWLEPLISAGVPAVQIREKGLADRDLLELVREARRCIDRLAPPKTVRLFVNGRADIATAANADGVHLPARGGPIPVLRRAFPHLRFGRSTHTIEAVVGATEEGADYVTFGPVFETPSKAGFLEPTGLDLLSRASDLGVPVIALGGVVEATQFFQLASHGAAGVAGIRLFRAPRGLEGIVSVALEVFT